MIRYSAHLRSLPHQSYSGQNPHVACGESTATSVSAVHFDSDPLTSCESWLVDKRNPKEGSLTYLVLAEFDGSLRCTRRKTTCIFIAIHVVGTTKTVENESHCLLRYVDRLLFNQQTSRGGTIKRVSRRS